MASQSKDAEADNVRGDGGRHPLRIAVVSSLLGAIVGSLLTFGLPIAWNYFTAPLAPPTVLSVTPEQLTSWHKGINQPVQANALAEQMYYGKWVSWEGEVRGIDDFPAGQGTLYFENFAASGSREQVKTIKIGDQVRVLGKLRNISNDLVLLNDCRLELIGEVLK
jgi:hypothetical protein